MIRSAGRWSAPCVVAACLWASTIDADYRALETVHLRAKHRPAEAVLVKAERSLEMRPSAEVGSIFRAVFVVPGYDAIRPREARAAAMTASPLRNTYWRLVRLGETPVVVADRQREPHLIFALHEMHVSGSGGCNRIMGTFTTDGDKLRLGRMASTRMACPSGMEQEDRFLRALESVESFRINGSRLDLLDTSGTAVARFEAVALR